MPRRTFPCLVVSLALLSGSALSARAEGPAVCGPRKDLVDALAKRYQEEPRAIGILTQNGLVEIFASQAGTWTMLVTQPKGVSCVMAAGHSWGEVAPARKFTGT